MFITLVCALTITERNYARAMPSSDHNVYNSCIWDVGQTLCSLHTYVAGESRIFKPEIGCIKDLY